MDQAKSFPPKRPMCFWVQVKPKFFIILYGLKVQYLILLQSSSTTRFQIKVDRFCMIYRFGGIIGPGNNAEMK